MERIIVFVGHQSFDPIVSAAHLVMFHLHIWQMLRPLLTNNDVVEYCVIAPDGC